MDSCKVTEALEAVASSSSAISDATKAAMVLFERLAGNAAGEEARMARIILGMLFTARAHQLHARNVVAEALRDTDHEVIPAALPRAVDRPGRRH